MTHQEIPFRPVYNARVHFYLHNDTSLIGQVHMLTLNFPGIYRRVPVAMRFTSLYLPNQDTLTSLARAYKLNLPLK